MKNVKKIVITFLAAVLIFGLLPTMPVYADGTVSVALSSSTVNIGDTVTVTATPKGPGGETVNAFLTFTFDTSKFSFVSCSEGAGNYGGGAGGTVTVTGVEKASITIKATAAGSASVSVAGSDLVSSADGTTEYGVASAGGATITVNNAASAGGQTAGDAAGSQSENANLSGDNSLKSLTISPGTLSPAFKYNTTSYTASVGSDVNSVAVSAQTSNEKATIESVSGNENLVDGKNTIKIVVKAENGVTATYTITVTKGGTVSEEPVEEEPEEDAEEEQDTDATLSGVVVNETAYLISEDFSEEKIPEDFSLTTVNYQGVDYQGVAFDKGDVVMLYLVPQEGEKEGAFFVYDANRGSFYSYVRVTYGERYLIALLPPQETQIPSVYAEAQLELGEAGIITAYQMVGEDDTVSEFFLFYAINSDGTEGWYQYDSLEGTYQRLNGVLEEEEEETDTTDLEYLKEQYNKLSEQYKEQKAKTTKIIAVFLVICVILVIIIINLLLRGGMRGGSWEEEEDELEEDDSKEETEPEREVDVIDTSRSPRERQEEPELEEPELEEPELDEPFEEEEPKEKSPRQKRRPEPDDEIEVLDLNDL